MCGGGWRGPGQQGGIGNLPGLQQAGGYLGSIAILMIGGQLIGQTIGSFFGGGNIQSQMGLYGAIAGLAAGIVVASLAAAQVGSATEFVGFFAAAGAAGPAGPIILGIAAAYMIAQTIWSFTNGNGDTRERTVNFKCMPWQPPISTGDEVCSKCNKNGLGTPCTKYKCESLGSGCRLLDQQGANADNPNPNGDNAGVNNEIPEVSNPVCIDLGKCGYGGGTPPKPELTVVSSGFSYSTIGSGATVKKSNGEAVRESDIINLTVSTDQYAFCKYNYYKKNFAAFDTEGELFNEGNYHTMNHTLSITIPWIEDERVQNNSGDELRLFIRCRDKCDKYINTDEYVVSFPINPSPNTTAPQIVNVTPTDPSYLPYGVNFSVLTVTLNERGKCKYDYNQGIQYGLMAGNFSEGDLSENGEAFYTWGPVWNLVGNSTTIYIKCQDMWGNNNTEDTPHTFLPTAEQLKITDYTPEKDFVRKKPITTEEPLVFSVTTNGGAFSGSTNCWWSLKGATIAADSFLQNLSTTHEYPITSQLNPGQHELTFGCMDQAFNLANITTNFSIEHDQTPPAAVRVFIEGSNIRILTNENAQCFYNTTYIPNCNFEQGTRMDSIFTTEHSLSYQYDQTYYIKCKDEFDNQNDKCAVIVKPGIF
ncbi:Uncharacterised protein [uncultured archaeon]|nr:Uncharacterised protein [uncultured archaeon]